MQEKGFQKKVFKEIVKGCYEQLIEVPKALRFRDLLKKMEVVFSSKEITMRDSTRKYLQRNLEKLNIINFQNIEGKLYVYSTSLTTEQLVILYVNTKTELDQLKKSRW